MQDKIQYYIEKFRAIRVHSRDDRRSPHKPLLILLAIGRCMRGDERLVEFKEIEHELKCLLQRFGHPRKSNKPQYPFWRLRNDKIWDIPAADLLEMNLSGDVSAKDLRDAAVTGGFTAEIFTDFCTNHILALSVATQIVDDHFPETLREAVLNATIGTGLGGDLEAVVDLSPFLVSQVRRRSRNAQFRTKILSNYEFQCSICRFGVEFPEDYWPGLDAAHIKWHSHRGPDVPANGISLCVLHHELFDWGALTIEPGSLQIRVASDVPDNATDKWLGSYEGASLNSVPAGHDSRPRDEYLNWHHENVFKG